jgi:hypothetical protein
MDRPAIAKRIAISPAANVYLRFMLFHVRSVFVDDQRLNGHLRHYVLYDLLDRCVHELIARNSIYLGAD